jgi:hypothetical protein
MKKNTNYLGFLELKTKKNLKKTTATMGLFRFIHIGIQLYYKLLQSSSLRKTLVLKYCEFYFIFFLFAINEGDYYCFITDVKKMNVFADNKLELI